jgi:ribonuclease P protein component
MAATGESFPGGVRLHRRFEFRAVQSKGRRFASPSFLGYILPAREGASRLGITVGRKIGNAVQRNRLKRVVREWFRKRCVTLPRPVDLLVSFRPGAADTTAGALVAELNALGHALARGGART